MYHSFCLEMPPDMPNWGGNSIAKGPLWALEVARHRTELHDETFEMPRNLVSSLVFHVSLPFCLYSTYLVVVGARLLHNGDTYQQMFSGYCCASTSYPQLRVDLKYTFCLYRFLRPKPATSLK